MIQETIENRDFHHVFLIEARKNDEICAQKTEST